MQAEARRLTSTALLFHADVTAAHTKTAVDAAGACDRVFDALRCSSRERRQWRATGRRNAAGVDRRRQWRPAGAHEKTPQDLMSICTNNAEALLWSCLSIIMHHKHYHNS